MKKIIYQKSGAYNSEQLFADDYNLATNIQMRFLTKSKGY